MATAAQIEAARRFAPPLIVTGQADRRGAHVRSVNKRAVEYAKRAGLTLEAVYPGATAQIRGLAPANGSEEASTFMLSAGLSPAEVYSPVFHGEIAPRWRWGWAAVGFAIGAAAGGPIWALAGSILGALP